MLGDTKRMRLRVKLSDDEAIAKGKALAATLDKIGVAEAKAKLAATEAKEAIALLKADVGDLRDDVALGSEYREVDVEDRAEIKSRSITTFRLDTGEQVSSRPMEGWEYDAAINPPLPFGERIEARTDEAAAEEGEPETGEPHEEKPKRRRGPTVVDRTGGAS